VASSNLLPGGLREGGTDKSIRKRALSGVKNLGLPTVFSNVPKTKRHKFNTWQKKGEKVGKRHCKEAKRYDAKMSGGD